MARLNPLGTYLRDRRSRLDPAAFGVAGVRRRTPGLRREEVAARANISTTWYTWLEQGRGGAPSADVLDRIARGLMLTDAEREHLFLIGLGRPPEVRYHAAEGVSPRLQRVLDALDPVPATVRTATWDIVAWNRTAAAVFTDYAALPPGERNLLKLIFCYAPARDPNAEWEDAARYVVAMFRADVARAGAAATVAPLVAELTRRSPDFARLWRDHDVRGHGDGVKRLAHPVAGLLALEFSTFAVDGRPDLALMVYNPATAADAARIAALVAAASAECS